MKKKGNNRAVNVIISIYIMGIISSFIIVTPKDIILGGHDVSFWGVLKTFSLNYWYIFIMWVLGLSMLGFVINLFIVFFRGFIYGVLIIHLIRSNFTYLLVITFIDLVLFIPIFILLSYSSIMLSYNYNRNNQYNMKFYSKLLLIATIDIFIYSILLEVVGGLYA